jgi:small subunit ribosomal protein S20
MPNTKSAKRRTKRNRAQALVNKIRKSKYKLAVKKMQAHIDAGKTKEAKNYLSKFHSQLMKVVKTGIVSSKTASRKISRITKKINIPSKKK